MIKSNLGKASPTAEPTTRNDTLRHGPTRDKSIALSTVVDEPRMRRQKLENLGPVEGRNMCFTNDDAT